MSTHVRILTNSSIVINRAASVLGEHDIPALIVDNNESARLAGFGTPQNNVDLLVNQSDFEAAKKILQTIDENL